MGYIGRSKRHWIGRVFTFWILDSGFWLLPFSNLLTFIDILVSLYAVSQHQVSILGGIMTKAELIEALVDRIERLTKKEAELIVNTVLKSIADSLANGNKVELRGFGSFKVKDRRSREGRNPKTGEKVSVEAKRVPYFKAGKELRERVNN
jgi:integration host factor subunit beta